MTFWYDGDYDSWDRHTSSPMDKIMRWFKTDPVFDTECEKYKDLLDSIPDGKLDSWTNDPCGSLAYVIRSDQISRNIYRGKAEAFKFDTYAMDMSLATYNN